MRELDTLGRVGGGGLDRELPVGEGADVRVLQHPLVQRELGDGGAAGGAHHQRRERRPEEVDAAEELERAAAHARVDVRERVARLVDDAAEEVRQLRRRRVDQPRHRSAFYCLF